MNMDEPIAALLAQMQQQREQSLMAQREVDFPRLCEALRRNDSATTGIGVEHTFFPHGYGVTLGNALQGNQHVIQMHLELSTLLPQTGERLVNRLTPLLGYIRLAPQLSILSLRSMVQIDPTLLFLFILAASNSQCLQELNFGVGIVPFPTDGLSLVLRRTQSISTLRCVLEASPDDNEADYAHKVQQAFATPNETLQRLWVFPGSRPALVDAMLLGLASHPRLHTVTFVYNPDAYPLRFGASGLGPWLTSTRALVELELGSCTFNLASMQSLVNGIRRNQSLVKLHLVNCDLSAKATIHFRKWMQTTSPNSSRLRELVLMGRANSMRHNPDIFTGVDNPGSMVAKGLRHRPGSEDATTFGSKLESLSLDVYFLEEFLAAAASQASDIRLGHLKLTEISADDWFAFFDHFPNLVHVHDLTVKMHFRALVAGELVKVLRRNGSLHRLHIKSRDMVRLTPKQRRLLEAFQQRNERVPQLLSRPLLDNTLNEAASNEQQTLPSLFPWLYEAIQPARRMAPNMVLIGMLSLGDTTGPNQQLRQE